MAKKPKPAPSPTIAQRAYVLLWSTKWRKSLTITLTFVGLLAGTITKVVDAAEKTEPTWPVLRYYMRDAITQSEGKLRIAQDQTSRILRDMQIENAEGKREATINDIAKWNVEISKAHDDSSRDIITKQLNTLTATKDRLDAQIRTLNRVRDRQ